MNKTAYSNEELLIQLASKGDAAAFYSVAAPYFEIEYLNLRHNGNSHTDAVEKILPDSSELFIKILGTVPENFGDWFKNNSDISSNESDEIALFSADNNLSSERNHFLRELQLHLLRTASEFNKKNRKKLLLTLRNPKTKLILYSSALIIVLTSVFIILRVTHSSVSISLTTSENEYKFLIGSQPKVAPLDSNKTVLTQSADSAKSASEKDTVIPAQIKVEEKVPETPPVRRVSRPKVVPTETQHVSQAPSIQPAESSPAPNEGSSSTSLATPQSTQPATVESSSEQRSE